MNQSEVGQAFHGGILVALTVASAAVMAWDSHTEPIDAYQPDGTYVTMTRREMGTGLVSGAIGILERAHGLKSKLSATRDFFTARSFG